MCSPQRFILRGRRGLTYTFMFDLMNRKVGKIEGKLQLPYINSWLNPSARSIDVP